LRLFTDRLEPYGREEQYERLYVVTVEATPFDASWKVTVAGEHTQFMELDTIFDDLIDLVAERNPDFYEALDGKLRKVR
jgi:hypothetical protein